MSENRSNKTKSPATPNDKVGIQAPVGSDDNRSIKTYDSEEDWFNDFDEEPLEEYSSNQ